MRTTITFSPEVAAAVDRLRRERGIGISAAVDELVRRGLEAPKAERTPFVQRTSDAGLTIDVSNVAEVLDYLDMVDGDSPAA